MRWRAPSPISWVALAALAAALWSIFYSSLYMVWVPDTSSAELNW